MSYVCPVGTHFSSNFQMLFLFYSEISESLMHTLFSEIAWTNLEKKYTIKVSSNWGGFSANTYVSGTRGVLLDKIPFNSFLYDGKKKTCTQRFSLFVISQLIWSYCSLYSMRFGWLQYAYPYVGYRLRVRLLLDNITFFIPIIERKFALPMYVSCNFYVRSVFYVTAFKNWEKWKKRIRTETDTKKADK